MFKILLIVSSTLLFSFSANAVTAESEAPLPQCKIKHEEAALLQHKPQDLKPDVLKLALKAYNCGLLKGKSFHRPVLTIIDYTIPSNKKRLWVFDLIDKKVLFHTLVAHGRASGQLIPKHFSNKSESHASSLGVFMTGRPYHGHKGYSMRLHGLEKGFNDHVFSRDVVMHGSKFVSESYAKKHGHIGRSLGCQAVSQKVDRPLIDTIKSGTMVVAYFPYIKWLNESSFLHCKPPTTPEIA